MVICLNFLKNLKTIMYAKLIPEAVQYIKFHVKFICNHLYLFIIYIICLELSTKLFFTTRTALSNTCSSVKPSISKVTFSKDVPQVPCIPSFNICRRYCFSFFSVIATFEVTSRIFILKCFNFSNYLLTLPFLLCYYIERYNHMEFVKRSNDIR